MTALPSTPGTFPRHKLARVSDAHPEAETWPEVVAEADLPEPTLSAYIAVPQARAAIGWYGAVFGARLAGQPYEESGLITHAGLIIGDSVLMLAESRVAEEYVATETGRPVQTGPSADALHIVVPDVDATLDVAARHGAAITRPRATSLYGRMGAMVDRWPPLLVATR